MIKRHDSDLQNEYFAWLGQLVGIEQRDNSYWKLARALHNMEFKWFVPNDDNRAHEGKNLREKFADDLDIEYAYSEEPASMLEVIVGLAFRCESIMADQIGGMDVRDWFWKLMENAGLDRFSDDVWENMDGRFRVDEILEMIVDRTYKRDGRGGLFPVKRDKKDQRKVELWYQMSTYLVENYYDEEALG